MNTGYDGRQIWHAMYSENCFKHLEQPADPFTLQDPVGGPALFDVGSYDNSTEEQQREMQLKTTPRLNLVYSQTKFAPLPNIQQGMCFEERVLYRVLSGMHTMTSISIYWKFYPPGTRTENGGGGGTITRDETKMNSDWAPNPSKFMQNFGPNPDRIKNLYFAFVVLLRAVKKGRDFFLDYEWRTGDGEEDERVAGLVKMLLDAENLKFCSAVFEAFDEKSMFLSPAVSRKEFKRGFFHLSSLMNCVKCSRCR